MNNKILYTILFVMFCAIIFLFVDRQNLKNKTLENFTDSSLEDAITNLGRVSKQILDNDVLTIPGDVNIMGKLTVAQEAEIGQAYIGTSKNDNTSAEFSHKNFTANDEDSAFVQYADGSTRVNSVQNKPVNIAQHGVNKLTLDQSFMTSSVPAKITDYVEAGPAFIGNKQGNTDFAYFSHKNRPGGTSYSLLSSSDGATIINNTKDEAIYFKHNDTDKDSVVSFNILRPTQSTSWGWGDFYKAINNSKRLKSSDIWYGKSNVNGRPVDLQLTTGTHNNDDGQSAVSYKSNNNHEWDAVWTRSVNPTKPH